MSQIPRVLPPGRARRRADIAAHHCLRHFNHLFFQTFPRILKAPIIQRLKSRLQVSARFVRDPARSSKASAASIGAMDGCGLEAAGAGAVGETDPDNE
ncbi:MAG: hypothetical protein JO331_05050 [Verrucomicrobia bacterium]|nr:hypothetical protein [Verrucomicrobiota bacterium]